MKTRKKCLPSNVYRRGHTYYVDVRVNGKRIRSAAGSTPAEAESMLARLLAEKSDPSPAPPGAKAGPTFGRLIDRYLERARLFCKPASVQSAESSARRLRDHFGPRRVGSLGAEDLRRFVAVRLGYVSREATNRDLRYLKAIVRLAVEEEQIDRPPFRVKLLRTTKKLPTILSPGELARLFDAADARLRPMLMTAAMTGLRHGELRALDWSDVDLGRQILIVRAKPEIGFSPKSHAEREVPISSHLVDVLEKHRVDLRNASESDPVFQRNLRRGSRWDSSALCAAVRQIFKDANLYHPEDRPGLHMLRRSFASHALARHADIETVRELGGWSDLAVVQRYVASTEHLKREAVERLLFTDTKADDRNRSVAPRSRREISSTS